MEDQRSHHKNHPFVQKGGYVYSKLLEAMLINQKRAKEDPNRLERLKRENETRVMVKEFQKEEARKNYSDR